MLIAVLEDNPQLEMTRLWDDLRSRHRLLGWKNLQDALDYLEQVDAGTAPLPDRFVVDLILKAGSPAPDKFCGKYPGQLGLALLEVLHTGKRGPQAHVFVLSKDVDASPIRGGLTAKCHDWGFTNVFNKLNAPWQQMVERIERPICDCGSCAGKASKPPAV